MRELVDFAKTVDQIHLQSIVYVVGLIGADYPEALSEHKAYMEGGQLGAHTKCLFVFIWLTRYPLLMAEYQGSVSKSICI